VRVNAIAPGWIEVGEWQAGARRRPPQHTAADLAQHPVGRVGRPEDIAELVAYLASPAAGFITGTCLPVDGGMTHKMIYV
jgi:NAD(P)-dependent dehydrogenase (short-subunit alcohol dehydrogenase family)